MKFGDVLLAQPGNVSSIVLPVFRDLLLISAAVCVCVCECVLASLSGGQPRSMQEDILQLLDHYFLFFPEFPVPASCPANVLARFVCLLV